MESFMSQRIFHHLILLALVTAMSGQLRAQMASDNTNANTGANTTSDNPAADAVDNTSVLPAHRTTTATGPYKDFFPDPSHIAFILQGDIPWKGQVGHEQTWNEVGDPSKPGFYVQILKWWPGNHSMPHFHGHDRFIAVLSGTWWVSNSTVFDWDKTYPLTAGTLTEDVKNTVHWDGSKPTDTEPAVLEVVGIGPVPNINVDENGKPLPPRPRNQDGAPAENGAPAKPQ
jgi:hypothetical protein